ncbi:Peptide methionine sulfoxide reductase MsrB [Pseudoalteromonas sp. CIP111854]|uniref:Peptide methionine sulfoxide reductase MsrB n=1 Tax=Pseudoalteromonas holothuriae TaxID=2963714 RepID=A0A9W4QRU4_9GAMM|nr:peptide-methionine (R)-S-oxide reductase MsrB [Pseudoalteromonas sp. CIP111854]CAH9049961.1 Peptide methionine sulfoxide reductase MsrB [Pseudoalteromonas sp. CIP111854]
MLKWKDILNFAADGSLKPTFRVEKSPQQWQNELSDEVYFVTRDKGTERPYSSASCSLFEPGKYACACCDNVLFDAHEKFESGSGWPSFTQPVQDNAIAYISDSSAGMQRIEIICNACDAHLGHVFPDGPPPSGLRYCVNALSMVKL